MERTRDEKGRFVSNNALALLEQSKALSEQAELLIQQENEPPSWLKGVVIAFAQAIGITPEEFQERVKVVHPTPDDPVLLIDRKPVVSWI